MSINKSESKNTSFEAWAKNLTSDDIDVIDKLENMCENEINEELVELINKNKFKYYPRIEQYVKEHVNQYKSFIVDETCSLFEDEIIDSMEDWSSGLYNCDEIYVRAVADALGFLWLVN